MMKSIMILLGLLSIYSSPCTAAVMQYNLTQEWSESSNPNGVWRYLVDGSLASSAERTGDPWNTTQHIWGYKHTGWSKSNGTEAFSHDWSMGDVFVHTSEQSSVAINWISPEDGVVDILGGLWAGRDIGRSNNWSLTLNGVLITSGSIYSGDPYSSAYHMDYGYGSGGSSSVSDITVNAGDILGLTLVKSSPYGDYVGVDLLVELTTNDPPPEDPSGKRRPQGGKVVAERAEEDEPVMTEPQIIQGEVVEISQERVKIKYSGAFVPVVGDPVQIGFKDSDEFIEVKGDWRIVKADRRFAWAKAKGTDQREPSVGYTAVIRSTHPKAASK